LIRPTLSNRGFTVVAAVIVLAILGMLAIAAANSVQFTFSFVAASTTQSRLSSAMREGAVLLQSRPDMVKGLDGGTAVVVFAAGQPGESQVTASRADLSLAAGIRKLVPEQAGDVVVVLNAGFLKTTPRKASSVYLINTEGRRTAPILLKETNL
jgi:hypothetical protein